MTGIVWMVRTAPRSTALCIGVAGSGLLGLLASWLCKQLEAGDAVSHA
jgi:hypothetical protein